MTEREELINRRRLVEGRNKFEIGGNWHLSWPTVKRVHKQLMSMAMATIAFQPRLMYSSSYPMSKVCSSSTTMHGRRLSYNCCCCFSRIVLAVDFVRDGGPEYSRKEVLRRVDFELARNNEREAVSLVMSLQGKPGGLRGFGAANQVPQRLYTLEELRLNQIDTTRLLSPVDTTLGSVRRNLQLAAIVGGIAAWNTFGLKQLQLLSIVLALLALGTIDLVINGGGVEALLVDTIGRVLSQKYRNRVVQHEAGHFLIAYLLGVLPKGYALSSLEAFKKEGSLNVQAGTTFVDFQFLEEVKSGKISSQTLNTYSCIALAGVATEYLLFGSAEGGLVDIQQLENLLRSLSFTQQKTDSQVRWAVLNTVTLLRRHKQVQSKLVEAMSFRKPVGECIDVIEDELMNVANI